jgi:hypothetical protein
LLRVPSAATLTLSEVTAYAMCGRRGSTLTVCASPMWLVRPISFDVADVDDLDPAARGVRDARRALVVAAPGCVARVQEQLRVGALSAGEVGVEHRLALRRRLDVVLQPERRGGVRDARGRRVVRHELRIDLAFLGQAQDRLAAAVGRAAELADRGVDLPALREVVEVRVRVRRRDRRQQLPLRVLAAGVEVRAQRGRRARRRRDRMVEVAVGDGRHGHDDRHGQNGEDAA